MCNVVEKDGIKFSRVLGLVAGSPLHKAVSTKSPQEMIGRAKGILARGILGGTLRELGSYSLRDTPAP